MDLTFDLGNMFVYDPHPVIVKSDDYDEYLLKRTQDCAQALVDRFFELPRQSEDQDGIFVELPPNDLILPREKSVPVPKIPTRWEELKKRKNMKKSNNDKLVYSERHDEFRTKYGHRSKNEGREDDEWVIEDNQGQYSGNEDPFIARRQEKKKKLEIQRENQMNNLRRRRPDITGGSRGDMNKGNVGKKTIRETYEREKAGILNSFDIAREATASLGNFDSRLKSEPKRSELHRKRRQQFSSNVPQLLRHGKGKSAAAAVSAGEGQEQEAILNRVLKAEETKRLRIVPRSNSIFKRMTDKQNRQKKKVALLGQNKGRWYKNNQKSKRAES